MGTQQFCLRWNNHQANLLNVFDELLTDEAFVDVTLACEGLCVRAHKMVLSACSPYFKQLFLQNPCKHPIVILKDINFHELRAIIEFMYKGEVNISHEQLSAFLKTAETLKVKGLAEVRSEQNAMTSVQEEEHSAHDVGAQSIVPLVNVDAQQSPVEVKDRTSPTPKRRRVRSRGRSPSGSASDTNDNNVQQSSQPQEVVGPGDLSVVQLVQAVTSKHSDVVKLEAEPSSCSREDLVVIPDHVPVSNVSGISSGLNQEDSSGSFIHGDQSDRPSCMAEQQWDPSNHVQPSASGLQAIPSQGGGLTVKTEQGEWTTEEQSTPPQRYSRETLNEAVRCAMEGYLSIRDTSRQFNVPRTTLRRYVQKQTQLQLCQSEMGITADWPFQWGEMNDHETRSNKDAD